MTPSIDWITWCRIIISWSRWPRGLRHGSAVARLLGLRVRITPGTCMSLVSVMRCQVEVSATGWSLVHMSPIEWVRVSLNVIGCNNNHLHLQERKTELYLVGNKWWRIWKQSTANLRYYPDIPLKVLRKSVRNNWQDSCCPAKDLNPRTPKYRAGEKTVCLFSSSRGYESPHFLHPAYISETQPRPNHLSLKLDVMPLILKMDATYSSEKPISTYVTTQCQNQDVYSVQNRRRENLQTYLFQGLLCA